MSERCELSDLPVEQCACRVHGPHEEPATDSARFFRARYQGVCSGCEHRVFPGDLIMMVEDRPCHEECAA